MTENEIRIEELIKMQAMLFDQIAILDARINILRKENPPSFEFNAEPQIKVAMPPDWREWNIKIPMIKLVRKLTGLGLKEAKLMVETPSFFLDTSCLCGSSQYDPKTREFVKIEVVSLSDAYRELAEAGAIVTVVRGIVPGVNG